MRDDNLCWMSATELAGAIRARRLSPVDVTAAVLTAFIVDIRRFASPSKLVAYFGALPLEVSSGVDRDGQARGPRRYVMSRRGNDPVRR